MSSVRWRGEISVKEEDWVQVKDLFVRAFYNYPLYIHMEPDDSKRTEFLRRYLEANYDVAVRHGRGKLLLLKYDADQCESTEKTKSQDIISALLFAPPADDRIAWALQDDKAYWKAYEKENLSEECIKRVIAYESWEREKITAVVRKAETPVWNGLFCAIDPDFYLRGLGSCIFENGIRIMLQHQFLQQDSVNIPNSIVQEGMENTGRIKLDKNNQQTELQHEPTEDENLDINVQSSDEENVGYFSRMWNSLFGNSTASKTHTKDVNSLNKQSSEFSSNGRWFRFLHSLAFIHHMPIPNPNFVTKATKSKETMTSSTDEDFIQPVNKNKNKSQVQDISNEIQECISGQSVNRNNNHSRVDRKPVIAAISHSPFTAHFYQKNGFKHIAELVYNPDSQSVNDCSSSDKVSTHLLLMDPLKTGKIDDFSAIFEKQYKTSSDTELCGKQS